MVKVLTHPLIEIKLTCMRDKNSDHIIFKKNLNEITSLMVYEIFVDYKTSDLNVTCPTGKVVRGKKFNREIVIVPILRAGLGMVEGIEKLIPQARVGHIGIYRDKKTFKAHKYFYKMPAVAKDSEIILVDPMLATGESASDAINALKNDGFTNIKMISIVGAVEGVRAVEKKFPDVNIYLAALDSYLDEKKYINPGLGDAGDRLFGTK